MLEFVFFWFHSEIWISWSTLNCIMDANSSRRWSTSRFISQANHWPEVFLFQQYGDSIFQEPLTFTNEVYTSRIKWSCVTTSKYFIWKKFSIQVIRHSKNDFHITSTNASNVKQSKISCIFWEVQPLKAETSPDSR